MKTRNFHLLIFLLLILMALAISCSKKEVEEVKPTKYVIEGHLYRDCNLEPVVGKELFLIEGVPNAMIPQWQQKGIDISCKTDSNGYYKFTMIDYVVYQLSIGYYVGTVYNSIIDHIPQRTNFNDLDLFIHPAINLEVYLNVTNPYTKFDTLVANDFKSKQGFRMPGPFKSGFAFRADSVYFIDLSMRDDFYGLAWYKAPYAGNLKWVKFGIDKFCDNTVYLTIDIE